MADRSIQSFGSETNEGDISQIVREKGGAIVRGLVLEPEIQELKKTLITLLEYQKQRMNEHLENVVHNLMLYGDCFLRLLENQYLLEIARDLLGHGTIVHAYNSSSLPPGGTNYTHKLHVDSPRIIPGYLTNVNFFIALDSIGPNNGPLELQLDSFLSTTKPSDEEFDRRKTVLDNLNPGDAVVFNARCWHRSLKNDSSDWRHAITLNCCRNYMRQQFDFPKMIPPQTAEKMSATLKQFLGFWVQMPVSMKEYLAPSHERPYRPGQE